jgi:hypothetical protein
MIYPQNVPDMIEQFARPDWGGKLALFFAKEDILAAASPPKCQLFFCICQRY